jgi:hypothetical protein
MVEQVDHGARAIAHDYLAQSNLALGLQVDGLFAPFASGSH